MRRCSIWVLFGLVVTRALAHGIPMTIHEVFVGPPAEAPSSGLSPDQRAQYVMLRLTQSSAVSVDDSDVFLRLEDADGNVLGRFGRLLTAPSNIGPAGCAFPDCPGIVIGTQAADDLLTFSFDQLVDGQASRVALPPAGGRICFVEGEAHGEAHVFDCVAWGTFDCRRSGDCVLANGLRSADVNGGHCETDYGAPAAPGGLEFGFVLARDPAEPFECANKENSTQYELRSPHPENNAEQNDDVDDDGDDLINVLDCDDASAAFRWPIADAQNLRTARTPPVTLSYSQAAASGTGVTYDVARGTLAQLSDFTDAIGLACGSGTGSLQDSDLPSGGFYYLVRARSSPACGAIGAFGAGAPLPSICP